MKESAPSPESGPDEAERPDPRERAREWVAAWRAMPVLGGEPIAGLLTHRGADLTAYVDNELVDALAEAFATFDELEARRAEARARAGAGNATGTWTDEHAEGSGELVRIQVPDDGSLRSQATVLWGRARGVEVVGPDGRPAMAPTRRPSWIAGWFRYRLGSPRGIEEETARRAAKRAALKTWRSGVALLEALGASEPFRESLVTADGIDIAPLVLSVLAHGVDSRFPQAAVRLELERGGRG